MAVRRSQRTHTACRRCPNRLGLSRNVPAGAVQARARKYAGPSSLYRSQAVPRNVVLKESTAPPALIPLCAPFPSSCFRTFACARACGRRAGGRKREMVYVLLYATVSQRMRHRGPATAPLGPVAATSGAESEHRCVRPVCMIRQPKCEAATGACRLKKRRTRGEVEVWKR